ncbi:hypothetical protein GOODEAATRI_015148, partial [Goodea atripinnis]
YGGLQTEPPRVFCFNLHLRHPQKMALSVVLNDAGGLRDTVLLEGSAPVCPQDVAKDNIDV